MRLKNSTYQNFQFCHLHSRTIGGIFDPSSVVFSKRFSVSNVNFFAKLSADNDSLSAEKSGQATVQLPPSNLPETLA